MNVSVFNSKYEIHFYIAINYMCLIPIYAALFSSPLANVSDSLTVFITSALKTNF